jgi:hypothetical protein
MGTNSVFSSPPNTVPGSLPGSLENLVFQTANSHSQELAELPKGLDKETLDQILALNRAILDMHIHQIPLTEGLSDQQSNSFLQAYKKYGEVLIDFFRNSIKYLPIINACY